MTALIVILMCQLVVVVGLVLTAMFIHEHEDGVADRPRRDRRVPPHRGLRPA